MLSEHPIDVMILATDLGVAREFYGDRIGLEVLIESQDFLTFTCGGDSRLVVTRSATGTSEPQTKASWRVNDLAAEVAELRSRGINVEEYDEPGLKTVDLDPARQAGARGLLRAVPHRDHRRGEHVSQSHGSRGLPAREPRRRRVPDRLPVRHRPAPARLARLRRTSPGCKGHGADRTSGIDSAAVEAFRGEGARVALTDNFGRREAEEAGDVAVQLDQRPERSRRSGATGPPRSVSPSTGVLTFE